jgi:hypothetical protein
MFTASGEATKQRCSCLVSRADENLSAETCECSQNGIPQKTHSKQKHRNIQAAQLSQQNKQQWQ